MLGIHKRPYQHVQPVDCERVCTCLTCMLAWNNLNLILDFASWRANLEAGEPIPMIPRGKNPRWNRKLISHHADIVLSCLEPSPSSSSPSSSPNANKMQTLIYARILQSHLSSTVHAISRHSNNKGNKRRRFLMSKADKESGRDAFLEVKGPPSMDFPFARDNYYMLEAFLPNRGWMEEREGGAGWVYMPGSQHERDVEMVRVWVRRREEARRKELGVRGEGEKGDKGRDCKEDREIETEKGQDREGGDIGVEHRSLSIFA